MDLTYLAVILCLGTLGAVLIFSLVSKWRVEKRRADDDAPKSALAVDGPDTK